MVRKYAEKINMGSEEDPLVVDFYHDSDAEKIVSYALQSFRTLNALKKAPQIDVGKGIEVYSAKLPQFDEESRTHSGFIHPSPYKKGVYWVVMDERLTDEERLGVAFHELSHLAGGYNDDEKKTQATAIDCLANLARNYDKLNDPKVSEVLSRDAGISYDISEMDKEGIGRALKYLMDTSPCFGLDRQDLENLGVGRFRGRTLERRLGIFFLVFGMFFLLFSPTITGNVIGTQDFSFNYFHLVGFLFIFLSVFLLTYKKIFFKRLV